MAQRKSVINVARRPGPGKGLGPRVLMTDDRQAPAALLALIARLPAGTAVVLRHYAQPGRAGLAAAVAGVCRRRRLVLLIAGDARLARRIAAAGLHLPEYLIARGRPLRALMGRPAIVTAAAHGGRGLARAARAGVDAVFLSPVYPTPSHPERRALGLPRFAALVRGAGVAVYGLGGVNGRGRVKAVIGAGAAGTAGISLFEDLSTKKGRRLPASPNFR